jgi:hypothetical protein
VAKNFAFFLKIFHLLQVLHHFFKLFRTIDVKIEKRAKFFEERIFLKRLDIELDFENKRLLRYRLRYFD